MRLIFDIETNGLLDTVSKVYCLVIKNTDDNMVWSLGPDKIKLGLDILEVADELIGHNIIGYDIPALQKLYPDFKPTAKLTDTLVLARLIHSDIKAEDTDRVAKGFPKELFGSHSLAAWGQRIGFDKMDYQGGWDAWSQEMQTYCEIDVEVTHKLWLYLKPWDYSQTAIDLEHEVYALTQQMERNGWPFDVLNGMKLYSELAQRRDRLKAELQDLFPSWEAVDREVTYKRDNKKLGVKAGDTKTFMKIVQFNPGSRQHIERCLVEKYKWKPAVYTPSGQAKIDDEVLSRLPYPEAKALAEFFLVEKRIGQLAEGDQAWLKVERGGKIHGRYNPNGTVTGRATHSSPNISQVPSVAALLGKECRSLFHVPSHWRLVGSDYSGLELRCLAHYMAHFDNGEYVKVVTEGDVHTVNQKAAGLPTRNNAKTFIYAFLYGAGDEKIGSIIGKGRKEGKALKESFLNATPALKRLRSMVATASKKGFVKAIDGRLIPVRSEHAALNSLLQATGAVLCKDWIVNVNKELQKSGLKHGWDGEYVFLGWVHDEIQIAVKEGLEDQVGEVCLWAAKETGKRYGFRCPLAAEFKVGSNWAETH
jgi:hypothetical protein